MPWRCGWLCYCGVLNTLRVWLALLLRCIEYPEGVYRMYLAVDGIAEAVGGIPWGCVQDVFSGG
ncbi:MAG: hypothetical protein KF860_14045 [Cyclobacteriaceae bacterium]|nr:hypothetical protein [Cyclobacteriaceae bacterium]